ncbi:Starch-binding associating with outer membrane [Arachidicoccus rhizosphaerae]|uniref:Starch-binding associating with outer membrane n=1 Tax=Arachidicoccus rhizosphaerae TaxID=551991 RepID=A0A1H3VJK2_9BACT|nr:SusD/RagB family nutrient-binding outer membrane lipoprotein [Arachidicoccus rhizosphaerae]SDZ74965.1 Starch-binding associating with outer membrane [Arachidicoccus rhizosphaerae]
MKNIQYKISNIIAGICALLILASLTGCSKFLDVNQNPNNPESADPNLLLPTAQVSLGVAVGNSFQIYGNVLSQYWTQNSSASQYKSIEQYAFTNANFNYPWVFLYRDALINLQIIIDNATDHQTQYAAIAYLLKAYGLQLATDAFGDVPNKEALKGEGNPTYDPQEVVYDSIFQYIEKGKSLIDTNSEEVPGSDDLLFGGDMSEWMAFANTLELKAYLRLSEVDEAKSKAGVQALYAENAKFLDKDAAIQYSSTGGNQNPLYINMVGLGKTQNLVASATIVTAFKRNNDPRLNVLFDKISGQDTIAYIKQGDYQNAKQKGSAPSALVGGNAMDEASALAPVRLISESESYFLQAEAVARGWSSGSIAAGDLFKKGIEASFTADGIESEANAYIASAADAAFPAKSSDQIKAIIVQKYYAMCGSQGFEAWTEWRRTGYPDFFTKSVAAGNLGFPARFLYPNSEVTSNLNYPGTVSMFEPVWWNK